MPYLYAFIAVFFWSFNVLVARVLMTVMTPVQLSFLRWAIAACILFPFMYKRIWAVRDVLVQHYKIFLFRAMTGILILNLLIYKAAETASVIDMALLSATGPIFLVIFSYVFYKQAISIKQIIGFTIALSGVVAIVLKGNFSNIGAFVLTAGDAWILLKSVDYGLFNSTQSEKIKGVDQLTLVAAMIFVSVIALLPFYLVSLYTDPLILMSNNEWLCLLYMGTLPAIISFWLWNLAIEKSDPPHIGIMSYVTPILSSVEAVLIMNEPVSRVQIVGGGLVLIGVFVAAVHRHKVVARSAQQ